MTFSEAIREEIAKRFSDGQNFNVYNFKELADKYNKPLKDITYTFRNLEKTKRIRITGETMRRNGGSPHKSYSLVVGVKLESRGKNPSYQEDARRSEIYRHESGLRLEAAMSNWR